MAAYGEMSNVGEMECNNGENEGSMEIDQIGEDIPEVYAVDPVHKCLFVAEEVLGMILTKLKWADVVNCTDVCTLWREHALEMIEKNFKFNYGISIRVWMKEKSRYRRSPSPPLRTPTNPIQFCTPEHLKNFRLRYPDAYFQNGNELHVDTILLKLTSQLDQDNEIEFKRLELEMCKEMVKMTGSDPYFEKDILEMTLLPWQREEHEEEEASDFNIPNEMNITNFLKIPLGVLSEIKMSGSAKSILPYLPHILRDISQRAKIRIKMNLNESGNYRSPSAKDLADAQSRNLDNLVLMLLLNGDGHQRIFDDIANILPNLQTLELCGEGVQQLVSPVVQGQRLGQNLKKLTIHGNIYNVYNVFMQPNALPKLQELHIRNGSLCCQDKQGSPHGPAIFKVLFNLKCLTRLSLPLIGHPKIGWWNDWLGSEYRTEWPWPYLDNLKLSNGQCCGPPRSDLDLLKLKCPNLNLEFGQCVNAKCNA